MEGKGKKKERTKIPIIHMSEWVVHYQMLLTEDKTEYISTISQVAEHVSQNMNRITTGEVERVARKMKNGKSAKPGDIPVELIKDGPGIFWQLLASFFNKLMINELESRRGCAGRDTSKRLVRL